MFCNSICYLNKKLSKFERFIIEIGYRIGFLLNLVKLKPITFKFIYNKIVSILIGNTIKGSSHLSEKFVK